MKNTLYIKINFSNITYGLNHFGTLNWDTELEKKPLKIIVDDIEVDFFIKNQGIGPKDGILFYPEQYLIIKIKADNEIYKEIKKSKNLNKQLALKLYNYFSNSIKKVVFCFYKLEISPYIDYRIGRFDDFTSDKRFFSNEFELNYSFDNEKYTELKIINEKEKKETSNKIKNPIFFKENLLDKTKWNKLCKEKDFNLESEEFILELLNHKSKILLGYGRFKILEISILFEIYLIEIVTNYFKTQGFSNSKLNDIGNNFNLSSIINIYLPLILGKLEYNKLKNDLDNLDKLRKIRNDIVHRNKTKINEEICLLGIDSGIKICKYFYM